LSGIRFGSRGAHMRRAFFARQSQSAMTNIKPMERSALQD
jgi:hypothetical protein